MKEQVGIYLDESVMSLSLFTPDLDLFDMNRIEVLRGPQGTLFGSGSIAGTVRFISNQPDLERTEIIGEGSAGVVDGGSFDGYAKAAVNMPLVEGKAAVRAVGYYNALGGYIDAIMPDGIDKDVNDGERYGGRLAIRFEPNERLTITPRVLYQEVEIDGFNRTDVFNVLANPFTTTRPAITIGKRQQFTQLQETFTDEFLLLDGTIEYAFDGFTFTSVTTYTDRDILQIRDGTQLAAGAEILIFGLESPGISEAIEIATFFGDETDYESFSEEARISSNGEGRLEWVAGVFYSNVDRNYGQSVLVPGFEDLTGVDTNPPGGFALEDELFASALFYDFKQVALFGEATYAVNDRLDATFGIRWFDFDEDRILNFDGVFTSRNIEVPGSTSSDGVSPRAIVSYRATDDLTLNAQASKGFRLGGINDPLNEPVCSPQDLITFGGFDSWKDETLWNYEIGAKANIAEGRGTLNIAAFYADIDNLQATLTAGTCSSRIIFNVPKARSIGVEAELFLQPTDYWEFAVAGSYTDSEFRSTVVSDDGMGNISVLAGIEKGNRLPTVPRFQFSASTTFTQPVLDNEGFFTFTVQHVGSRFTQSGDVDLGTIPLTVINLGDPSQEVFTFNPKLDAYTLGNIRIGVRGENWEIAAFITNLWDENARLALDQELGTLARAGFLTNKPRTFGVSLRGNF